MSSWRESDPEPTKPSRPARPVKPSSPTPKAASVAPASENKSNWRGKSRGDVGGVAQAGPVAPVKDWLNPEVADAGFSRSSLGKWTKVVLLFTAFVVSTMLLIQWLFFTQPPLPLFAISVGKYENNDEFRENPFGDQQRKNVALINRNYVFPFPSKSGELENDRILSLLKSKDWLKNIQIPSEMNRLGDPVTAYYINCFARIQPESIELYHQSSNPFSGGSSEDSSAIDLQELLENLVSAIPKSMDRYCWVILDLQLPHTVSALGDLSPPWKSAVTSTLEKIKRDNPDNPEWYDRLIITLPAVDGQNNWLAPEYSASFFGYHLFKLLDTPQENASLLRFILDRTISLKEFQENLSRRVREDVAKRRFALQTPIWLPTENLERLDSLGLVGGSQGTFQSPAVEDPTERMRQIQQLWKKLNEETLRDAYRWDPVGYAKVESQLLALEDFAIYQPTSFVHALGEAEQSLSRMMKPEIQYGVSLIEDGIRADYFCCSEYAEQLLSRKKISTLVVQEAVPQFWNAEGELNSNPAKPQVVLSDSENFLYVWEVFLAAAKGDSAKWLETFQKDRLDKALSHLKLDYESDRPPPLEIYLLQRLRDDIDWRQTEVARDRAEACARALVTFEQLQRLSSSPEPLLTRAMRESLGAAESGFLLGFDWLLAGDTRANNLSQSIEQFSLAATQIQRAHEQLESLATAIQSAQESLWIAPHLLGWLLREYQFASPKSVLDIESNLKELGQLVDESLNLLQRISRPNGSALEIAVDGSQFKNRLLRLKQEFRSYVESKTGSDQANAAPNSPETFRRNRIALKCPLLDETQRARIQQGVASYLAKVGSDSTATADSLAEQESLGQAFKTFLEPLNSASSNQLHRQLYELMVTGDIRYRLVQEMSVHQLPTESDGVAINSSLSNAELPLRILATAFGDAPSLNRNMDSQMSWPFSAASLRWKLAETERCVWQVARLAEAGWGNGSIPTGADPKGFYFGRLGNRYLSRVPSLSGTTLTSRSDQLVTNGRRRLEERAKSLTGLTVRFGKEGQPLGEEETLQAPIFVGTNSDDSKAANWKAVAAVFMGEPGQPLPWREEQADDCVWAVTLSSQAASAEAQQGPLELVKSFATSYWNGGNMPIGNLAVRGNLRRGPIEWRSDDAPYIPVSLTKDIRREAEIYVDAAGDAPILNVVVLIDCSNSMNLEVGTASESEGSSEQSKTPLFELVSTNVKRFINELAQAHSRREADIRVCLIPFGIGHYKSISSGLLKGFLSEQRASNRQSSREKGEPVGHFYASKEFLTLNEDGKFKLEQAIDELGGEAKFDTPLYDSALEALERIKRVQGTSGDANSHVVAFTDGVHYVEVDSPYKGKTTKDVVLEAVEINQSRLSIFHYDYFSTWIREKTKGDPSKRRDWEKVESEGVSELKDLMQGSSGRVVFVQSNDPALLVRESLETIPRTFVVVESNRGSSRTEIPVESTRTGFQARIAPELLPSFFDITSKGTRGDAEQRVQLIGGERVVLTLSARRGGDFGFPTFDPDSNSGWTSPTQRQRSGGGFSGNVWFSPDWRKPLSFIWMMRHQQHPKSFTARPKLTVGMISSSQDLKLSPFILADSYFEPGEHYPRLRFPQVPWLENTGLTQAQLTLWVADELPSQLERRMIEQEAVESGVIKGIASLNWKRSGTSLTVDIHYSSPPKMEDRLVVICPSSESADRKYFTETNDENCVFSWNGQAPPGSVEIQIATVGELKSWVQQGVVTEFSVDQVPTATDTGSN